MSDSSYNFSKFLAFSAFLGPFIAFTIPMSIIYIITISHENKNNRNDKRYKRAILFAWFPWIALVIYSILFGDRISV